MRKHVTPAHPRATILDPARNRRLPATGLPVAWSAYWARLEQRGDVTVSDVATDAPAIEPTPEGSHEGPPAEPTAEAGHAEPDPHG